LLLGFISEVYLDAIDRRWQAGQKAMNDFIFKLLCPWGGFPPATPERSDPPATNRVASRAGGGQVAGGESRN